MRRSSLQVPAVTVLEEAFDLLTACAVASYLRYYVGTLPFVLALCAFVLDVSRNPAATGRVGSWALGLAVLYLWMKGWQASFAEALRRRLEGGPIRRPIGRRVRRVIALAAWHGIAPWMLLLAALATVPYAWVSAFFHALGVTDDAATAWEQAKLWPVQNHTILAILALLAGVVALNVAATLVLVPWLLKSVLGIETAATSHPLAVVNSTLLVVTLGVTYALVGPLAKAAYTVRAFYGDARASGADLEARLGRVARQALLVAAMASVVATSASAGDPAPAVADGGRIRVLDAALERELGKADYDWSRVATPDEADLGLVARWMKSAWDATMGIGRRVAEWIGRLVDWLLQPDEEKGAPRPAMSFGWLTPVVVVALAVLLVAVVTVYLLARVRLRKEAPLETEPAAVGVEEAIRGEDALARHVAVGDWLTEAQRAVGAGDYRRAARATYLATLSFLSGADLLQLARYKSNRDYRYELELKSRRWPGMTPAFADSIRVIERVWYGRHVARRSEVERLDRNLARLRELHVEG